MGAIDHAQIQVEGPSHAQRRVLHVRVVPRDKNLPGPVPLKDESGDRESSLAPIQLLEARRYSYEFEGFVGDITTDHEEVFHETTDDGHSGIIRPRLNTGTIHARVYEGGRFAGTVTFEVRSRKLDYLKQYQHMLGELTDAFANAVMLRFATGAHSFRPDHKGDAQTLYQQFAFLQSALDGGAVEDALHHITAQPHMRWSTETEFRDPARGARASSRLVGQIAQAGRRVAWPAGAAIGVPSLPRTIAVPRTVSTVDNTPNRFVRYALQHWRYLVSGLSDQLQRTSDSRPVLRGRAEARRMGEQLDRWLAAPLFREVGRLTRFPTANQVLEKKAAYRDVFRTFLQSDLAAQLTWDGGERVYGAGKRNVAALYEYWTYLKLAEIVRDLCSERAVAWEDFVDIVDGRPRVTLNYGSDPLEGSVLWKGREIRISLYFNRTFSQKENTSWTRTMRPDCSICFHAAEAFDREIGSTWVHFDAKYRVEHLKDVFDAEGKDEERLKGVAKGDDLLKMHAYRDAIHRSSGAYILYPGEEPQVIREYHEILPGLGAFCLRPGDQEMGTGTGKIREFLEEVLDHFSNQLTQHERSRYWRQTAYGVPMDRQEESVIPRPPADTIVVLGFVKSPEHWVWIRERGYYNVRDDEGRDGRVGLGSRVLAADLLVLYDKDGGEVELWSTSGSVELWNREKMADSEYPSPRGERYFCIGLDEVLEAPSWLSGDLARSRGDKSGWPVAMSWQGLAGGAANLME